MRPSDVARWPVYSAEIGDRIRTMITRGDVFDYAGAPPVTELEQKFSSLHEGLYAVSLNSGTSAMFAALLSLGVSEGDEVIIPNLTFMASGSPLLWLDAKLVLADSDSTEPSIGVEAIASAITPLTRAVVVTHLFGNPVDVVAIAALCRCHNIRLIEDCSHAHASTVDSRHVGTFGDAAIYSIGAGKLVSGGHGGILITPHSSVRDVAVLLGHFKPRTRRDLRSADLRQYAEFALGGNLRLSPVAAALALDHLDRLSELSHARQANVDVLDEAFTGLLEPVRSSRPRRNGSHFDIVYMLPAGVPSARRDELLDALSAAGTLATAPSTRPLNRVLHDIGSSDGALSDVSVIRRLRAFADAAPPDDRLAYSTGQHDRMVSFPAARLYAADAQAARWIARAARPIIKRLVEEFEP
ncbi:DegT/DnrJ/EryC1/StrS family aminotransferase [Nocardia sp. CA-135953]|uniref:DegT/DnrJ/EryC1/StrS family aminotransferase n=1 Tax=Nocardia sp. CA-135953 TaxID=3239978 RepID=UPI003D97226E